MKTPDSVVVDIGAGAGTLGDILRRDHPGVSYRFYEPIESVADHLEGRFGHESRLADSTSCADVGIFALLDVIEHVSDPSEVLRPIVEQAHSGTLFVITVPALSALWSSWDEELGHYRRYTKGTLRAEIIGWPLDVMEVSYLFPELLLPALARRFIRRASTKESGDSEFPELPRWLDRLLLAIGRTTYRGRRVWPAGTTAVLVARKR